MRTISRRIQGDWRRAKNKSDTHCDVDGAPLWQGPGGSVYCDKLHTVKYAVNVCREGFPDELLTDHNGEIMYFNNPEEAQTTANIESISTATDEELDFKVIDIEVKT